MKNICKTSFVGYSQGVSFPVLTPLFKSHLFPVRNEKGIKSSGIQKEKRLIKYIPLAMWWKLRAETCVKKMSYSWEKVNKDSSLVSKVADLFLDLLFPIPQ